MKNLPKRYKKLMDGYAGTLKLPKQKSPRPIALAPFGPCCVGKTTTMTYIAQELPFVHLNHDVMRLFIRKKVDADPNPILYNHLLIVRLAKCYLKKGYSVILDRDFGTNNKNVLRAVEKETKKMGVKFFLIKITAPQKFIKNKIYTRKLLPPEKGGITDRDTAWRCYTNSITYYKDNYKKLTPRAITVVDTSKSLFSQLKKTVSFLKQEMGL